MEVTVYTLEDSDGNTYMDSFYTYDYREARDAAREAGVRVIANEYEYADSYLVDDFTSAEEVTDP